MLHTLHHSSPVIEHTRDVNTRDSDNPPPWHIHRVIQPPYEHHSQQLSLAGNIVRSREPMSTTSNIGVDSSRNHDNRSRIQHGIHIQGQGEGERDGSEIVNRKGWTSNTVTKKIPSSRIQGLFDSHLQKDMIFKPVAGEKRQSEKLEALAELKERQMTKIFNKNIKIKTKPPQHASGRSLSNTKKMVENTLNEMMELQVSGGRRKGPVKIKETKKTAVLREQREKEKHIIDEVYKAIERAEEGGEHDMDDILVSSIRTLARREAERELHHDSLQIFDHRESKPRISRDAASIARVFAESMKLKSEAAKSLSAVEEQGEERMEKELTSLPLLNKETKYAGLGFHGDRYYHIDERDTDKENEGINRKDALILPQTKAELIPTAGVNPTSGGSAVELKNEIKDIVVNAMQGFFDTHPAIKDLQALREERQREIITDSSVHAVSRLAEASLSNILENARYEASDRDEQYQEVQNELDNMEGIVNSIESKLNERPVQATREEKKARKISTSSNKMVGKKILMKERDKLVSREEVIDVREYRNDYEKRKALSESNLLHGSLLSQASLMSVLGDSIIDEILLEISQEMTEDLDDFAELLFTTL